MEFPAICTIPKKIKQKVLLDPVVIVLLFILQTAKRAQTEAPLETISQSSLLEKMLTHTALHTERGKYFFSAIKRHFSSEAEGTTNSSEIAFKFFCGI